VDSSFSEFVIGVVILSNLDIADVNMPKDAQKVRACEYDYHEPEDFVDMDEHE